MDPLAVASLAVPLAGGAIKFVFDVYKMRADVARLRHDLNGKLDRRFDRLEQSVQSLWQHMAGDGK